MANGPIQGVRREQEIRRTRLLRDTRTLWEQTTDLASTEFAVAVLGFLSVVGVVVFPFLFDILPLLALAYAPIVLSRKEDTPFRKRKGLNELDEKDLHPGTGKPMMARGIGYIGNREGDNAEIWAANEDMRTHIFVLGSTGAGKTEGLTSMAFNAITWCSGFAYVDGKGDVSLWGKIFSMVRQYGREDDLLVINYMTGNADTKKKRIDKPSNTYNPFSVGNADSLIQLVVSLMDASDGKGDMWKGRAISFISAVLPALVDLRDQGRLMLHIGAIREFMPYPKYTELMNDPYISDKNRTMLQAFLYDVPGYKKDGGEKQSSTFLEQFGYQQMQFTRILSSLADTYGYIYFTPQGEVNFQDVVRNNRILLVLLPALEKSRPELSNLGKIIVAAMKGMMGAELGGRLEGSRAELLDNRATMAPTPFIAIFDEFGYFMPEDAALMWAQARSLGFCLVAAGQDLQAFYRTSKEETLAIWSNSNVKIIGKMEDSADSYDLIEKRAGQAYVAEMSGWEMGDGLFGGFKGEAQAKHTRVNRIDLQDMVNQIEGQVHIFVKSDVIRARMFYAVPTKANDYRLNHFVKVMPVSEAEIRKLQVDTGKITEGLLQYPLAETIVEPDGALHALDVAIKSKGTKSYQAARQGAEVGISLFEAAVAGLKHSPQADAESGSAGGYTHTPGAAPEDASQEPAQAPDGAATPESTDDVVFDGSALDTVTVFGRESSTAPVEAQSDDMLFAQAAQALAANAMGAQASSPSMRFMDAAATSTALADVAMALGATDAEARTVAREIVGQVASSTRYPAPPKPERNEAAMDEMAAALAELTTLVSKHAQGGSTDGQH